MTFERKERKAKKKEKNISKFKERLFTESEEIFPMSLNTDRLFPLNLYQKFQRVAIQASNQ